MRKYIFLVGGILSLSFLLSGLLAPPTIAVRSRALVAQGQSHHWNSGLLGIREKVVYERIHYHNLTLYLFHPRQRAVPGRPVVIYIHGGALRYGSALISQRRTPHNRLMVAVERQLIQAGVDFISVNYRLAPLHPWPDALIDVKHALSYLGAHAALLDINGHQMAVMGDSAGGELSSFVGLTMNSANTERPLVRAVVDLFGPTNRRVFASEWRKRFGLAPNPVYGVYTWRRAIRESAVTYVHPGAPPFLIVQGTQDTIVPPSQSALLKKKLHHAGVPVQEILVHHAGHELIPVGGPIHPGIPVIARHIVRFLTKQLVVRQT